MTENGRLALSQLVEVEGQHLSPSTADAYLSLRAAAHQAGHTISIWEPAGAYRSADTQRDMHVHPERYNLNPRVRLAAEGQSRHGQGRAVDIKGHTTAARAWVRANAARHGLTRPMPVDDPDHYENGASVITVTDATPAPAPPTPRGDDMKYIFTTESGTEWAMLDPRLTAGYLRTKDEATATNYRRMCPTPPVEVTRADFEASISAAAWYKTQCPTAGGSLAATAFVDDAEYAQGQNTLIALLKDVTAKLAANPAAVVEEMKKPGN